MIYRKLFLAGALAVAPFASLHAAAVQIVAQNPVIELSVSEQVNRPPDTATFSTGVESKAKTATEALRLNSAKSLTLIQQLKSLGVAEKDIQTSGINLNADYFYNQATGDNRFTGYRVSNQVSIIVRDLEKLGGLLDAIVSVGGTTNLNGPYFSLGEDNAVKKIARKRALESAKAQAVEYAQSEGYSDVRVLSVAEGLQNVSQGPMAVSNTRAGGWNIGLESGSVPVQAGQVGTTINPSITYEMVR